MDPARSKEPLLLEYGDGWSRAAAARMPRIPKEIKALRDAFAAVSAAEDVAKEAGKATKATILSLLEVLAEAAEYHRPRESDAQAQAGVVVVDEANLPAALRAIALAAYLPTDRTVDCLGRILRLAVTTAVFAAPALRIRDACVDALITMHTKKAAAMLTSIALAGPTLPERERLLIAADRSGRTLPSMLAEASIPSHGLDENGMRVLAVNRGEYKREYLLTLHQDGHVAFAELDPGAPADPEAERAVAAEVAAIREAYRKEVERLSDLLATDREWPAADWDRIYQGNPITRAVACGLVWSFLDRDDARGRDVVPGWDGAPGRDCVWDRQFGYRHRALVRLWHPVEADGRELEQWKASLPKFETKQPIPQIDRTFVPPHPQPSTLELTMFAGLRLSRARFERTLAALRWRNLPLDPAAADGATSLAQRDFPDARLTVTLSCLGSESGAEDPVTLISAWLHWTADPERTPIPLGQVPPRVVTEAWYDLTTLSHGAQQARRPGSEPKRGRPEDERPAGPVQVSQPEPEDAVPPGAAPRRRWPWS